MKNLKRNLVIGFAVLIGIVFFAGCLKKDTEESPYTAKAEAIQLAKWRNQMKTQSLAYDSTASKIYYIMSSTKIGTGPKVAAGDTVIVSYTGAFLDGTIFDFSDSFKYVHKASDQRLIAGWEEAIEMLNKGSMGFFVMPSSLAYGSAGTYIIPPYTPLIFSIEVLDIRPH